MLVFLDNNYPYGQSGKLKTGVPTYIVFEVEYLTLTLCKLKAEDCDTIYISIKYINQEIFRQSNEPVREDYDW